MRHARPICVIPKSRVSCSQRLIPARPHDIPIGPRAPKQCVEELRATAGGTWLATMHTLGGTGRSMRICEGGTSAIGCASA